MPLRQSLARVYWPMRAVFANLKTLVQTGMQATQKLQNCYQLASAGFGLGYTNQYVDSRLSYGRQITGNRGLDSNGNNSEGESKKHQLWLQVTTNF